MGTEKKYRYPGINFFTKEDRDVFCGRADDAQKLFNRVMLNNTMVLHGESGTGKSSLVQAGLIPLLEKQNEVLLSQQQPQYLPVTIRFDSLGDISAQQGDKVMDEQEVLVSQMLKCINGSSGYKANELPYISVKENSFWYTAKLFERNKYTLLLILDQFEELQGYTYKQIEVFAQKLSELFVSTMPDTIYSEYDKVTAELFEGKEMGDEARKDYNENIKFLEQPLKVRILFIVREDKLGTMSSLSDYFPNILKNDFFLLPLDEKGARRAIVDPAQKDGDFKSEKFDFDPAAVTYLLESLVDTGTGLYDPIQLQIVCSNIERKIAVNKRLIKTEDIPPVGNIINDFYLEIWKGIRTEFKLTGEEYEKKRKAIIERLVVSGNRNLVLEELLFTDDNKTDESIIKSLVREGLLRKVPAGKNIFYQLTHDRLMYPLIDDLKNLKAKENIQKEIDEQASRARRRKNRFLLVAAVLLGISTTIAIIIYFKAKAAESVAEEERYKLISTTLVRADNPTMGYVIAQDWLTKHPKSKKIESYLHSLDTSKYVYLTGMYPVLSKVTSAHIQGDSILTITELNSQSVWDIRTGLMVRLIKSGNQVPVKRLQTFGGQFDVFKSPSRMGDSIVIKNGKGRELAKLKEGFYDVDNIAISPDSNYLLIQNEVFSMRNSQKIAVLPPYKESNQPTSREFEQNSSIFLSNNRIAAAYENGKIRVFEIDEHGNQKIHLIDSIEADENVYSTDNKISAMAIDSGQHYLLAANSRNSIDIFEIPKPGMIGKTGETDTLKGYRQIAELKGHTGVVNCMTVSSDGKTLLSGSTDHTAILWDLEKKEKIMVMKGQNASEIHYVSFFNADRDIITASDENVVYVWKHDRPSGLYKEKQLYRFSPFNYAVWGLKENEDGQPRDTTTTIAMYSATLNYLLNMPQENDYPDDQSYSGNIKTAITEIKKMYANLTSRRDFHMAVSDYNEVLLDKYYHAFLLNVPELLNQNFKQNDIDRYILKAQSQIVDWKIYFMDTTKKSNVNQLSTAFTMAANFYLDKKGNYTDGLRLIRFYNDSVWQPLDARYGGNIYLKRLKKSIDVQFVKYYLYTGKTDAAIKIAGELSQAESKTTNYSLYLVAAYLSSDKYAQAATLYNDIIKSKGWKAYNERNFQNLLKRLKEKNIAVSSIDRFNEEFKPMDASDLPDE